MIEYFKNIFNKPQYMITGMESLAVLGLVLGFIIILCAMFIGVWYIISKIEESKRKRCANCRFDKPKCYHSQCINCGDYKKKPKYKK